MKITKSIVRKTAELAMLELGKAEEAIMQDELQRIINWMDQLKQVNTDGVEPLTTMSFENNMFREDDVVASEQFNATEALQNAPKQAKNHFSVPKVIK